MSTWGMGDGTGEVAWDQPLSMGFALSWQDGPGMEKACLAAAASGVIKQGALLLANALPSHPDSPGQPGWLASRRVQQQARHVGTAMRGGQG